MNSLGDRIKRKLSEKEMTIQRLAAESGISEPTIHSIFNRGDAKISQLEKISGVLETSLSFLLGEDPSATSQTGTYNQAGSGNHQKIRVNKGESSQELAAQLISCQRQLELSQALVAAKEEMLVLLRGGHNRPN